MFPSALTPGSHPSLSPQTPELSLLESMVDLPLEHLEGYLSLSDLGRLSRTSQSMHDRIGPEDFENSARALLKSLDPTLGDVETLKALRSVPAVDGLRDQGHIATALLKSIAIARDGVPHLAQQSVRPAITKAHLGATANSIEADGGGRVFARGERSPEYPGFQPDADGDNSPRGIRVEVGRTPVPFVPPEGCKLLHPNISPEAPGLKIVSASHRQEPAGPVWLSARGTAVVSAAHGAGLKGIDTGISASSGHWQLSENGKWFGAISADGRNLCLETFDVAEQVPHRTPLLTLPGGQRLNNLQLCNEGTALVSLDTPVQHLLVRAQEPAAPVVFFSSVDHTRLSPDGRVAIAKPPGQPLQIFDRGAGSQIKDLGSGSNNPTNLLPGVRQDTHQRLDRREDTISVAFSRCNVFAAVLRNHETLDIYNLRAAPASNGDIEPFQSIALPRAKWQPTSPLWSSEPPLKDSAVAFDPDSFNDLRVHRLLGNQLTTDHIQLK